jgi:hypothetical protein
VATCLTKETHACCSTTSTWHSLLLLLLPAGQHFEEVKYLTGQIGRLKDKLGLAERDLTVAHAIKVSNVAADSIRSTGKPCVALGCCLKPEAVLPEQHGNCTTLCRVLLSHTLKIAPNVLLQEKYRSALEAACINIAEFDAAAATANAAAAAAGPTTAAARTAVRRSLGGSSAHQLLGLSPPASPEPIVHGGSRRLSGQVMKSPQPGRASAAGLPPVSPKPAFRPAGSVSPGFGR